MTAADRAQAVAILYTLLVVIVAIAAGQAGVR